MITHEIALDHFHRQVRFALDAYKPHGLKAADLSNVIIGGLGGSGIGGRIARLAFFTSSPIPIEVISEYTLPAYAGKNTLVILCSYSGNTEETLTMMRVAEERGCKLLALSSGGHLTKRCTEKNIPCYPLEAGYQPRMALGFSLTTLIRVLGELIGMDTAQSLAEVEDMLKDNAGMKEKAASLMQYFEATKANKFVVICDMAMEAIATRFCQQVQENAKGEAFVSVLPEANHNMIESYYGAQNTNFLLLYSGLNERIGKRFDFLKELLGALDARMQQIEVAPFGFKSMFSAIHITDWLSIYLSNAKKVNNLEVQNINRLKEYLEESKG